MHYVSLLGLDVCAFPALPSTIAMPWTIKITSRVSGWLPRDGPTETQLCMLTMPRQNILDEEKCSNNQKFNMMSTSLNANKVGAACSPKSGAMVCVGTLQHAGLCMAIKQVC